METDVRDKLSLQMCLKLYLHFNYIILEIVTDVQIYIQLATVDVKAI